MDLVFKRQFSYYLITIYVPGCMLVIVSWVSFWLDPHAVPARVALGVTTLLTMSTQTASINSALPPVAYTKAIDVWQVREMEKQSQRKKKEEEERKYARAFKRRDNGDAW